MCGTYRSYAYESSLDSHECCNECLGTGSINNLQKFHRKGILLEGQQLLKF